VSAGVQDWAADTVGATVDAQAQAEYALARVGALRGVTLVVGGWVPLLVLLIATPWLVRNGVAAGAVLGSLVYVRQGLQPALHLLVHGLAGGGLRYGITLSRILEVPAPDPQPAADAITPTTVAGAPPLSLHGVTFRYGPAAEPVLADFDLDVTDDDHLVIVGASGIGKSTLAGLMAGTLQPQSGTVRLAGTPTPDVPSAALAAQRVLLPQEAYAFTGTVAANLTYLAPDASDAQLIQAVDALGAGGLLARLGGPGARLDPAAVSAGERQLLALVRAYLSTARLTILDEATCHLDPVAEAQVERAFADRAGALVIIAHRLTSAHRARRILLFDGAHPMLGSHPELLVRSTVYRDLVGQWSEPVRCRTAGD
jgi:ATP-binding cassette subfamily C protein